MASESRDHGEQDAAPDALEAALQVAAKLESLSVDYAIGGALALGCWSGEPRATIDADVNLFLDSENTDECLDLLTETGCRFDWAEATATLRSHGYCRVRYAGRQVDFFLHPSAFNDEARRRRTAVDFGGARAYVLDAETICVFKLMFFRTQDLADIEAVLRGQGAELDRAWIERQAIELFGERDPRVARWRELAAAIAP